MSDAPPPKRVKMSTLLASVATELQAQGSPSFPEVLEIMGGYKGKSIKHPQAMEQLCEIVGKEAVDSEIMRLSSIGADAPTAPAPAPAQSERMIEIIRNQGIAEQELQASQEAYDQALQRREVAGNLVVELQRQHADELERSYAPLGRDQRALWS